jgi:sulfur-oxidizing protein SoxZ
MSEAMKIRATLQGDSADLRVLIKHPMETGTRKTASGIAPAHFIQSLIVQHNGKTVFDAQWSQSVSRDPVLGLRVRGAKAGDRISITWMDNRGERRMDETVVTAGP